MGQSPRGALVGGSGCGRCGWVGLSWSTGDSPHALGGCSGAVAL